MIFILELFTQELIQNADDAEATKVVFIHDERGYGNESLFAGELEKYQGTDENLKECFKFLESSSDSKQRPSNQ